MEKYGSNKEAQIKEMLEKKYAQTYDEKISFNEVKQSGKFLVGLHGREKE